MANQYYVYFGHPQVAVAWPSLSEPPPLPLASATYIQKTLLEMEAQLGIDNLTFYITSHAIDELPKYGPSVVAIVLGDEWARVPRYADRVRAIFKCYGTQPILGLGSFKRSFSLNVLTLMQFCRVKLMNMPYQLLFWLNRAKSVMASDAGPAPIYQIPLGYCNQLDLPIKAISDRPYDISFAGSIVQRQYPAWSPNRWMGNPKILSRKRMIAVLKRMQETHPHINIELKISAGFRASRHSDEMDYSQQLMSTKICLAPRGTSFETYRFFEAMRYGCVAITEALPDVWFYRDSPAIEVTDWSELAPTIEQLISDPALMQQKHKAALNWWETVCSEKALGAYIAKALMNSL